MVGFYRLLVIFLFLVPVMLQGQTQHYEKQNVIRIKLKESHSDMFEQKSFSRTKGNYVRTGVNSMDMLNERRGALEFRRVFSEGGKFNERRRKFGLHLWYEVIFDTSKSQAIAQLLSDYSQNDAVEKAEPLYKKDLGKIPGATYGGKVSHSASTEEGQTYLPDDPRLGEQWHYNNTGQTGGTSGADIELFNAWDIQKGTSDVIVSIHDGGVDFDHEDLSDNMWVNTAEANGTAGVDDDGNGYIDDIYGYNLADNTGAILPGDHGTHVAGTVAAVNNNGIGVAGVAGGTGAGDGARIMSCQVFGNDIGGFAESYAYAADNGAIISQNSWGYSSADVFEQSVLDAIDYFIANAGYDELGNPVGPMQGGIVIFAAGNDDANGDYYPGFYDPVLSVAATNHNDQKSWYSNYGSWVDIAAPGGETMVNEEGVLSTLPNDAYGFFQGTSMACPHVSGVAALIVSEYGGAGFTPLQLRNRLIETTEDIDAANPSYAGLLGSGRMNAFAALVEDEGIAPDAITDLAITDLKYDKFTLTWTAPADADNVSASSYEIRYSESPITEANFDAATFVASMTASSAGSTETYTLSGLTSATTYYAAVKAYDFFNNGSLISNVVDDITQELPVIEVTPASINSSLFIGETETYILTIENTGAGDLEYSFPSFVTPSSVTKSTSPRPLRLTAEMNKGEKDIRQGVPVLTGAGEDDGTFGYAWEDSNEPGGPSFDWVDISATGIPVSLSDDGFQNIPLPFTFPFYEEDKTAINIGSNGFLTFNTTGAASYSNQELPLASAPNDLIALLWRDLNPSRGGQVYYQSEADKFIVQFQNVMPFSGTGSYTFQCILFPGGDIKLQYLNLTGPLINYTTGIEDATGSFGMEMAFNAPYIEDNLAVLISSPKHLVAAVDPISGTITPGATVDVALTLDATYLHSGVYEDEITVESNDPDALSTIIPITLNVTPPPDIDITPAGLAFPSTFTGASSLDTVWIANDSDGILNITSVNNSLGDYSLDLEKNTVDPGGEIYLAVEFSPSALGQRDDVLEIHSDDPDEGVLNVSLSGEGIEPPEIEVNPTSLTEDLLVGETQLRTVEIGNKGNHDLEVTIDYKGVTSATIIPGTSLDVEVFFDATDLNGGTYNSEMIITSNDPIQPVVTVPITLHVTGIPDIDVSSNSLQFGEQFVGATAVDSLLVSNSGTDRLTISSVSNSKGEYKATVRNNALDPGDETYVVVEFIPTEIGQIDDVLKIFSDDPDKGVYNVTLSGAGIAPPVISVDPVLLSGNLFIGETVAYIVVIENQGSADLDITANYGGVTTASIAPGSSYDLEVLLDATGLSAGTHESEVTIESNDPVNSLVKIPVTIVVTGASDINISAGSISFPDTYVGTSTVDSIKIVNDGVESLVISSVEFGGTDYALTLDASEILPGNSAYLKIEFTPSSTGLKTDQITIVSNDPVEGMVIIDLSGSGTESSEINISVIQLIESLSPGEVKEKSLTVRNDGKGELTYAINISNSPGESWLTLGEFTGLLEENQSAAIALTFNAGTLSEGSYTAEIVISSNDPEQPEITIPVSMNICESTANTAPEMFASFEEQVIFVEDEKVSVDLIDYFSDADGDDLSYAIQLSAPIAEVSSTENILTVAPKEVGDLQVIMTVSDGCTQIEGIFAFTIDIFCGGTTNLAPEVVHEMEDVTLDLNGEAVSVDLSVHFQDPNGESLTYTAIIEDESKAQVEIDNGILEIRALALGTTAVAIMAEDERCSSISTQMKLTVISITGVDGNAYADVTLYPNPADRYLELKGIADNMEVHVWSLQGILMDHAQVDSSAYGRGIDVSSLENGTYVLEITTTGESKYFRFVVMH